MVSSKVLLLTLGGGPIDVKANVRYECPICFMLS